MVNVGLIGVGYWGSNLARVLFQLPDSRLHTVCDKNKERLDYIKMSFPLVKTTQNYRSLLEEPEIEATVVATEAQLHYQIAKDSLMAGKHVLVEKPLSLTSEQCRDLIEIAKERKTVLMTGHTFEYNAAVRKLKEYINKGDLGKIYYIYSHRLNLGKIRQDINALWNFAPHDISIILYLLESEPIKVSAQGLCCIQEKIEDVVFLNLTFANGIGAHIHISWLDPSKVRRMTVVGSKKMIIYDDVEPEAKIQVYDKGIDKKRLANTLGKFETFGDFQLLLRAGDIFIPKIDFVEPLKVECHHFIDCIKKGKKPLTDGANGLRVVKVLESAQKSLDNNGIPQDINQEI
ncbi:MAG: Gfo/Idh/MocA family protein [Candidatus Lokiarchaeia archaeon]